MSERVVNIIGMGPSSTSAPDTGENWGLNVAYKGCRRMDKLFYFDSFTKLMNADATVYPKDYSLMNCIQDNPHIEIISKCADSIKGLDGTLLAPIKEYPLREALQLAPGGYFTSTIAYTICYAILEKVDRIRLYGFEVWSGSDANEYMYQRPCVDFWLAFAMGRGIKVEIPWYLLLTATNTQNFYGYVSGELTRNTIRR